MALGENLFLFVWAVIANAKDFLVDYVVDVASVISPTAATASNRGKTSKRRSKQRSAYFQRVKRQMGIFTPDKKKKKSLTQGKSMTEEEDTMNLEATVDNLLNFSGDASEASSSGNRLEDLEAQLLVLKKEMAFLTNVNHVNTLVSTRKTSTSVGSSSSNSAKEVVKPATVISCPPPPPPPPMAVPIMNMPPPPAVPLHLNSNSAVVTRVTQTPPKPRMEKSLSIADMIRASKRENLRSTTVKRSPGGTPVKGPVTKSSSGGFQSELFAAIKNKFRSQEEDSESDDDFGSPSWDKENTPPQVSKTGKASQSPMEQGRILRPLAL